MGTTHSNERVAKSYYTGVKDVSNNLTPAVRLWNNGVPVKMDTYKTCNNCIYCFARSLSSGSQQRNGVKFDPRLLRVAATKGYIHNFISSSHPDNWINWCISQRYYIELGTMAEVFQEIDKDLRYSWHFLQLCRKFKLPLMINSKCNLLVDGAGTEYFDMLVTHPAPILFNVSMVTGNEKATKQLEPHCPTIKQRFELVGKLREYGIPTICYLAPYMKGYTDIDLEDFVEGIIKSGFVSIHLRNFFVTGPMFGVPKWKAYTEQMKKGGFMKAHGHGCTFTSDEMQEVYYRIHNHAKKIDPEFEVVGMKKEWFELDMNHGRLSFERLPDRFGEGITDFCIIPMFRLIRDNHSKPQLLLWEKIGHKRGKIAVPPRVPISGDPHSQHFIAGMHKCSAQSRRNFGKVWMEGYDWVKGAMWNGLEGKEPGGFISSQMHIHPVKDGSEFVKDSTDSFVYAYVPKGQETEYVNPEDGCVQRKVAEKFITPKRAGDTSDKFGPKMKQISLGPKWREG